MPADSRDDLAGGDRDPAGRLVRDGELVDGRARADPRQRAHARHPPRRPARADRRQPARRAAPRRAGRAARPRRRRAAFEEVIAYAERRTREALRELPDGDATRPSARSRATASPTRTCAIAVAVTVDGDALTIDFAGTATRSRATSTARCRSRARRCYFALRVAAARRRPGQRRHLRRRSSIEAPEGSLVNAQSPAAVVAGNVETSQRDRRHRARGARARPSTCPAQGQGTMNNLIIGGAGWTYYETIGGGQGASADGPGPSGVHVGMSQHAQHPDRGARARVPDARRALRAARRLGRRRRAPRRRRHRARGPRARAGDALPAHRPPPPRARGRGRAASPGACGENLLNDEELPPKAARELAEGDVVTVRTPGGGGYGKA